MTDVRVEFVVALPDEKDGDEMLWWPATDMTPDVLLESCLKVDRLRCCVLKGGFRITIDGHVWNEHAIDEMSVAYSWLRAFEALLNGATEAQAWPWEESNLRLFREGDRVRMEDISWSGAVVCTPVVVPLIETALALAGAAEDGGRLLTAVLAEARSTAPPEQRRVLVGEFDRDWADGAARIRALAAS
jgi:hypothetical protein